MVMVYDGPYLEVVEYRIKKRWFGGYVVWAYYLGEETSEERIKTRDQAWAKYVELQLLGTKVTWVE